LWYSYRPETVALANSQREAQTAQAERDGRVEREAKTKAQGELNEARVKLSSVQTKLGKLQLETDGLQVERDQLLREKSELQAQALSLQREAADLQTQVRTLKAECDKLTSTLEQQQQNWRQERAKLHADADAVVLAAQQKENQLTQEIQALLAKCRALEALPKLPPAPRLTHVWQLEASFPAPPPAQIQEPVPAATMTEPISTPSEALVEERAAPRLHWRDRFAVLSKGHTACEENVEGELSDIEKDAEDKLNLSGNEFGLLNDMRSGLEMHNIAAGVYAI
jgi:hypothetical protein